MGNCTSGGAGSGGGGGFNAAAIKKGITEKFLNPFNSKNDANSPYWVSSLKDAIGKEAFMQNVEITEAQVSRIAEDIISRLPTAEQVRERFRRKR